jgi:hypothetical protein
MAAASACHHQLLATDSVSRQLKPPVYPSITRYECQNHDIMAVVAGCHVTWLGRLGWPLII